MKLPIINSILALAIHLIAILIMLKLDFGIYALAIGNVIFAFLVCIFNSYAIRKNSDYKQEVKKTFILPTFCSVIMGIIAFLICNGTCVASGSNILATCISIILAMLVYGLLLIKMGCIEQEDMQRFVKNKKIHKLLIKLHIIDNI